MKLAIMQPYLFPYIGYFQLIRAVDTFVMYDDVNYINKGWINRNRILVNGAEFLFTLNLNKASQNKLINEITIGENSAKLLKTVELAYKRAAFFESVFPIVETIVRSEEKKLHSFIANSLTEVCRYLNITTKLLYSSDIEKHGQLRGQEKIVAICRALNADTYLNPVNGKALYEKAEFKKYNIDLLFLQSNTIQYSQFDQSFIPWLSIIDVMMFNSRADITAMLDQYSLT
jgi:hypothetical protein